MGATEKLILAKRAIREEIQQLEDWARESSAGGWSTHQVQPQLQRAKELSHILWQIEGPG